MSEPDLSACCACHVVLFEQRGVIVRPRVARNGDGGVWMNVLLLAIPFLPPIIPILIWLVTRFMSQSS